MPWSMLDNKDPRPNGLSNELFVLDLMYTDFEKIVLDPKVIKLEYILRYFIKIHCFTAYKKIRKHFKNCNKILEKLEKQELLSIDTN